ncbi:resolvase domain-containing protein [Thioploca ingrica]|uniref:Resolvase domain-containing protein n=1 Tax=Thioploca ingrica TaxID=40754 RepID=A0A090AEU6_9GAMM|nr:resolvase domain-containing protein [Thioploca ingrica]
MTTAVIHARVSTDEQAAEQLPIKSQVDADYAWAEKLGAKVGQVFIEEGASGRSMHRGVFLNAIQYCEKHKVKYFITWDAFRFSRQSRGSHSASVFKERLARVGTQIVYSSSGLTVDLRTPEGFLREGMDELLE